MSGGSRRTCGGGCMRTRLGSVGITRGMPALMGRRVRGWTSVRWGKLMAAAGGRGELLPTGRVAREVPQRGLAMRLGVPSPSEREMPARPPFRRRKWLSLVGRGHIRLRCARRLLRNSWVGNGGSQKPFDCGCRRAEVCRLGVRGSRTPRGWRVEGPQARSASLT